MTGTPTTGKSPGDGSGSAVRRVRHDKDVKDALPECYQWQSWPFRPAWGKDDSSSALSWPVFTLVVVVAFAGKSGRAYDKGGGLLGRGEIGRLSVEPQYTKEWPSDVRRRTTTGQGIIHQERSRVLHKSTHSDVCQRVIHENWMRNDRPVRQSQSGRRKSGGSHVRTEYVDEGRVNGRRRE